MQRETHEQRLDSFLERHYPTFETGGQIWTRLVQGLMRPGMCVLDAGAGANGMVYTRIAVPNVQRVGLDLAPLPLMHPAEDLVQADLAAIPVRDEAFDLITSEFVFEHLGQPEQTLRELWRVLRPGGHLIFITSNVYNPIMAFSRMSPYGVHTWLRAHLLAQPGHETFPTTYRANTHARLQRLGTAAGFRSVEVYRAGNPGYFTFSPLLLRGAIALEKWIDHPQREWLKMYLVGDFVK